LLASFEWLDKALGAKAAIRELASGEELFSQGASARAIFALESGRLRLLRRTVDGHLVVLHRARALFAEAALFSETYHCDAVAAAPSRVRTYQKNDVLAALRAHPDLCERFLGVLARQVQALRLRLEFRNIRSARERILQYLSSAAEPDGRTVRVEGELQEIASELGLSREAFYRALTALERENAVVRKDRCTILLARPVG
jgi:CRP-like cAMP-binding protein